MTDRRIYGQTAEQGYTISSPYESDGSSVLAKREREPMTIREKSCKHEGKICISRLHVLEYVSKGSNLNVLLTIWRDFHVV